jgi:hypothetical protein
VVQGTKEPYMLLSPKAFEKFGIHVVLMKDIIADLREQVKVKGSRDDIMRLFELIVFEESEDWKLNMKLLEIGVKGLNRNLHGKAAKLEARALEQAFQAVKRSYPPKKEFATSTWIFSERCQEKEGKT